MKKSNKYPYKLATFQSIGKYVLEFKQDQSYFIVSKSNETIHNKYKNIN